MTRPLGCHRPRISDRIVGLVPTELAVDGCIAKAPGGERSPGAALTDEEG